ncbi:MAG: ATPase [Chitinophagaceae bacterium]|nr:MAG: ATPase [Chitinophagaceae bacterium]
MHLRKIVILGPESTGKSILCQQLADHYQTIWCPEYAREYLLEHGTSYSFDNLLTIAQRQLQKEDEYAGKVMNAAANLPSGADLPASSPAINAPQRVPPVLFIDTDMYVMKVWCEFVFNNCHRFILDQIIERKYDLYLLCNTDLPWVKDELREYPDLENRKKLFYMYKDLMVNQDTPWVEISGDYQERLPMAIAAVDRMLRTH